VSQISKFKRFGFDLNVVMFDELMKREKNIPFCRFFGRYEIKIWILIDRRELCNK